MVITFISELLLQKGHNADNNVITSSSRSSGRLRARCRSRGAAVALTPAPTLEAALIKVEIIKDQDLDEDTNMPRDAFEIIAEDMARLVAGRG